MFLCVCSLKEKEMKKGKEMKNFIKLCISTVAISTLAMAASSTIPLTKGTSIGKYAKPGASVDISYTSQNVEPGQSSDVNITLTTSVKKGIMQVSIASDKGLYFVKETESQLSFTLNEDTNEYLMHFEVSADNDGVYYMKLLVSIEGEGSRSFALPVYIGEGRVKKVKKSIHKSASGEKLSVSKAVESSE
jgi:hypothetical protein